MASVENGLKSKSSIGLRSLSYFDIERQQVNMKNKVAHDRLDRSLFYPDILENIYSPGGIHKFAVLLVARISMYINHLND